MSSREVLKNIVKFGKREYSEKKPSNLRVLRVKSKSILKRGMLPNLNIKQIKGSHFIVVADYADYIRIYSFDRNGILLGGENVEKTEKLMKLLLKGTTLEYHLPKEKPKLTIADVTRHYRTEFEKKLLRMNDMFGFNLRLPYSIIAHKDLPLRLGRTIGCAMDKKKNAMIISTEVYKKELFEFIATREILYLYLREFIVLFQDVEVEKVYWYDLAILLTNFYLNNKWNDYLINLMEKTTMSFLKFADESAFYFSDKVLEILKKNTKNYTSKEINTLFVNIFRCLKILKEYDIKLRYKEFANLFYELCELFLKNNEINVFKPLEKPKCYYFHYKYFRKTLEMDFNSEKSLFLSIVFSLLCNYPFKSKLLNLRQESLTDLISKIKELIQDPNVITDVVGSKKLISNAFTEYLFNNIIEINYKHKIQAKLLEIIIFLTNKSDFVLMDFEYELNWKPRKRISLTHSENIKKSRDLHFELNKKYNFTTETQGKITFFCDFSFCNPFDSEEKITKRIKLSKLIIKQ